MKNYIKKKESSYFQYIDVNNLYGWEMSQRLSIKEIEWVENILIINRKRKRKRKIIIIYDEESHEGFILQEDTEILKDLYSDLQFLHERMKPDKCSKLVCNLCDKNNYVVRIRALKQALNHGLVLKRVIIIYRVIRFNQKEWFQPYINMNTKLRKEAKNHIEKRLFKLMNNSVFGKILKSFSRLLRAGSSLTFRQL